MQISAVTAVSLTTPESAPAVSRKAAATTPAATAVPPAEVSSEAIPVDALSKIYITRVAGKDYSGDVAYASGVYTISVPGLPGAQGAGSSLFAAENALNTRIDILV